LLDIHLVTLYHLYNRYLSNVTKISAKINTMQNINILLFVHSLFLSSLAFAVKQGTPVGHQSVNTVKIGHDGQKPLKPKRHEKLQIVCKFVHKRCSKCAPFARTYAWRCFLHWSTAVSIMSGQKSDHRPTLLNCKALSLLRTVNEQKEKC